MNNKNIIFHIDFDSYFVSAHRSKDHKLKNKPVAVSNGLSRSICSSISYELKIVSGIFFSIINLGQPTLIPTFFNS